MANAEARTTALLFSLSAVVLLLLVVARASVLQPLRHGGLADLLLPALDRFLHGRGLLDLATRTNMILLCHAILLVILKDAGVLGAPSRRRGASPGPETNAPTVVVATDAPEATEGAWCAPARPRACKSVVVWRRPRNRAAPVNDATSRLAERQLPRRRRPAPAQAAAPWAAPALAGPAAAPAQAEEPVATKEIVLVEKAPPRTNHLPDHDRPAIVELEQAAACFDRRIVVADVGNARTAAEETREVELADDRRIEEFIAKQWSKIRQESLQLVRSGSQAITTC